MDKANPPGRNRRLWTWVLGISLALNLLFIGAVGGAVLRHMGADGPERAKGPNAGAHKYATPFVRALPREARRDLRRALRDEMRGQGLPDRAARREMQQRMMDILRADAFDKAAAEALFEAQLSAAKRVESTARRVWLETVAEMSVAQRQAVAARLEKGLAQKRPRDRTMR